MGTKRIKLLSEETVARYAAQIPYPVIYSQDRKNGNQALISVHETELKDAQSRIAVQYLIENGFEFQYAIEPQYRELQTEEFKPEFRTTGIVKKREEAKHKYPIGTTFKDAIGVRLEVIQIDTHATSGKDRKKLEHPLYTLKYLNASKDNLPLGQNFIDKNVKRGVWNVIV